MSSLITILKKQGAKALPIRKVDPKLAEERVDICTKCQHRDLTQPDEIVCTKCGCFMDIKATAEVHWNPEKLRREITHCPEGFWGDSEIANFYHLLDKK